MERTKKTASTTSFHLQLLHQGIPSQSHFTRQLTFSVSDEHCPYQCKNGQCIRREAVCNRHYDCTDGTDETTCGQYFKDINILF